MTNTKTVYVVGAGASSEAKLPTGNQLKENIANFLNIRVERGQIVAGDELIIQAIRRYANGIAKTNINAYLQASRRIVAAMPQSISIDNFIDIQKGDENIEFCGKLAIARSILYTERKSLLYIDDSNIYNKMNFSNLEEKWYSSFWKLLTENCTKDLLPKRLETISLIVFNYDRCIEHFLYNSLQNYYDIPSDEAAILVSQMEVLHPYGVVGRLPWQDGQTIDYGAEPDSRILLNLVKQIKTFTEGTDPNSSEIIRIRRSVSEADNIVFLGFAYHQLNMKLMATNNSDKSTSYFGTARGISDSDCKIIEQDLKEYKSSSPKAINISNKLDCASLFKEYWRSLSFH